jgi:two-component SAPR family response regulator
LWGEEAIDSGAQALKVLISRARQQLGFPALIEVRSGYVALHRDVAVDLDEVEKLLRSLPAHGTLSDAHRDQLRANYEQFKGSLTSGESSGATTPIESAIVATRHDIVERLAKDALEREQIPLAVDLANELRRQDSNDEAAHELLIRAHLHSGDRTSALREYRIYGERLKKDLGIDPDFTIEQIKNELDAFPALTIERRRLRRPSTGTDPPLKESR